MLQPRILPREQLDQLVGYLGSKYPKTFFEKPHQKRPLKKSIAADLEEENPSDNGKLASAVGFYCRDWHYEACLEAGAKRVDLNGKEVGTVTEQEAIEAQKRVQIAKRERNERLRGQGPTTVMRGLHANGKISTDQLGKLNASAIEVPPTAEPKTGIKTTPPTSPTPPTTQPNGADLTKLRALWASIENVLSVDDESLRAALVAPALKVFVTEATKLIATLEGRT